MGPGTHILTRLREGIQPISRVDAAAMIHDIEYLNPHISESDADANALRNAGSYVNPIKILMKIGFTIKDLFGGYKSRKSIKDYYECRSIVDGPKYQSVMKRYNLQWLRFESTGFLPEGFDL